MSKQLLAQGAEAKLFSEQRLVIKDRFRKAYRHPVLDAALRKSRTRREAHVLEKLAAIGFPAPKLLKMDDARMLLCMEKISGTLLKTALEKNPAVLSRAVAKNVALLHNAGIIHGDLTTSNMILKDKVYFIDFGLSFFSQKAEHRAVDLHVFKETLEAKHHKVWRACWKVFLQEYKKHAAGAKETIQRLAVVEERGRYKGKGS